MTISLEFPGLPRAREDNVASQSATAQQVNFARSGRYLLEECNRLRGGSRPRPTSVCSNSTIVPARSLSDWAPSIRQLSASYAAIARGELGLRHPLHPAGEQLPQWRSTSKRGSRGRHEIDHC